MNKNKLIINSYSQIAQVIIVSAIYFFLYRFILNSIGAKLFGIWALIVGTANISSIINLGMSGSTIKYVSKYAALNDKEKVLSVVKTAAFSNTFMSFLLILIIYPIIKKILYLFVPEELIEIAYVLLPFGLIGFLLRNIANIFQSALDGYERFYLRNAIWIIASIINYVLTILLVPIYGVKGAGYSFVVQNAILVLGTYYFLKRIIPILSMFPLRLNVATFKEMINYGWYLQINSIAYLFMDPIVKLLLGKFGEISMITYYEMANKVVGQIKMIIISIIQIIVPIVSQLKEKLPEKINNIYYKYYKNISYLSVPFFFLFMAYSPIISKIWMGRYENSFIIFLTLLCLSSFIWCITYCAEAVCLGTGKLRWVVTSNVNIALMSAFLGYLLGKLYDGFGVVIAWTIASIVGSIIKYVSFHYTQKIKNNLISKQNVVFLIFVSMGILLNLLNILLQNNCNQMSKIIIINAIIFSIITILFLFFNKARKEIYGLIKDQIIILKNWK